MICSASETPTSPLPEHRLPMRASGAWPPGQGRCRWRNTMPALYVIEDVHWIDEVSESMIARVHVRHSAGARNGAAHLSAGIPRRTSESAGSAKARPFGAG